MKNTLSLAELWGNTKFNINPGDPLFIKSPRAFYIKSKQSIHVEGLNVSGGHIEKDNAFLVTCNSTIGSEGNCIWNITSAKKTTISLFPFMYYDQDSTMGNHETYIIKTNVIIGDFDGSGYGYVVRHGGKFIKFTQYYQIIHPNGAKFSINNENRNEDVRIDIQNGQMHDGVEKVSNSVKVNYYPKKAAKSHEYSFSIKSSGPTSKKSKLNQIFMLESCHIYSADDNNTLKYPVFDFDNTDFHLISYTGASASENIGMNIFIIMLTIVCITIL